MADPDSFKLGAGNEDTHCFYEEERQRQRVDKLNQRLTMFAILVPLVIGAIVAYAYVDMKMEFAAVKSSGILDAQKLSENLESRFSSLSLQYAKLEETLNQQLATLEKSDATLAGREAALEKKLATLGEATPDKNQLQQALEEITSQLSPLATRIGAQEETLASLAQSVQENQEGLQAATDRMKSAESESGSLGRRLEAMGREKLDRRELNSAIEAAMETERKRFQNRLAEIANQYGGKIGVLQQRTDQLERAVTALANRSAGKGGKTPAPGIIFEHDLQ